MMNPIYQGAFPGTIENGRVPLPSRLRDIYEVKTGLPAEEMTLYCQRTYEDYNGFQVPLLKLFDHRLARTTLSTDKNPLLGLFDHNSTETNELSVDKTFRVSIPKNLRDCLDLDGRVVFVGAEDHIKLVNRMFWDI